MILYFNLLLVHDTVCSNKYNLYSGKSTIMLELSDIDIGVTYVVLAIKQSRLRASVKVFKQTEKSRVKIVITPNFSPRLWR